MGFSNRDCDALHRIITGEGFDVPSFRGRHVNDRARLLIREYCRVTGVQVPSGNYNNFVLDGLESLTGKETDVTWNEATKGLLVDLVDVVLDREGRVRVHDRGPVSLGTGDGSTTTFDLPAADASSAIVFVDGIQQALTEWVFSRDTGPNGEDQIVFSEAPGQGQAIEAVLFL